MPLFSLKIVSAEKLDMNIASYDYPLFTTTFETVYVQNPAKRVIVLSDGSQWTIRSHNVDEVFHQISAGWRSGDDIRVESREPQDYQGKYILKNARNNAICFVDLDVICLEPSKASYIEKIDENGYVFFTQDGFEWAIGWWGGFTARKWRKGDRIIINKSFHSAGEDYQIFNADKGSDVWASLVIWK